jgi:serine/threonine protein kinase/Flp pilus assembly protein TadD
VTPPPDARWTRLKDVFAEALDLPEADRAAFLDGACAGDPALRAEVEALLADRPVAEAEMEAWAGRIPPVRALADAPPPVPALHVGPYRLVREVGRGGMGTVFEATRDDGQYAQRVALKLIRAGAASADVQRRFRAERQILARLEHPHIARLLDGGVTPPAPDAPEGLPYFVLEFVDGAPLTDYADARRLGLDARLALFLDVCEAVAHAHRSLVVHRDLKPSNVLVADGGPGAASGPRVKLLDFGIAKVLAPPEGGADEDEAVQTRTGLRALTPEYAAPEQLAGGPVTTATDVYSLGVLLYELLTGRRPFEVAGRPVAEAERLLTTAEPTKPSTALARASDGPARAEARSETPVRLARRLRGDLDQIVLKALRADPGRRYASVDDLAADVRRHLDHLPVRARPDAAGYRAGRFVRRHRVGLAATALVGVALAVGLGAAVWQARVARDETARAQATLEFLQNTLYAAHPLEGTPEATLRQALDSAAARIDRDLAGQPLVAAGVHSSVGFSYNGLGRYEEAERHHRRSAALYAAAGRAHRLDAGVELLNLALALDSQGRTDEAIPVYERALGPVRAEGTRRQQGSLLNAYANALDAAGRSPEAERRYAEAIAHWRADAPDLLPLALNNLAVLYEGSGRARRAVPLVAEAARSLRDQGPDAAPRLGPVLATLGTLYDYTGRPAAALAAHDSALAVNRRTLGPDHPTTLVGAASRALVLRRAGRTDAARRAAGDAYRRALGSLPGDHYIVAHAGSIYGSALCASDSAEAGERLVRDALDARRAQLPEGHVLLGSTESLLGACLAALGRRAEAERLLVSGYRVVRADRGDADPRTADARERLAAFRAGPTARAAGR